MKKTGEGGQITKHNGPSLTYSTNPTVYTIKKTSQKVNGEMEPQQAISG